MMGWRKHGIAVLACVLLVPIAPARAAEMQLRWRFQEGQSLQVRFDQSVKTESTGSGPASQIEIEMQMHLSWRISEVDAERTATIEQTLDRFTVSMKTAQGTTIQYDSAADSPATGPARGIAGSIKPLIGKKLLVTMTDRGQIEDVELPVDKATGEQTTGVPAGTLFSSEAISQVLRQSAVVLPEEPVQEGGTWTATQTLDTPLGKMQQQNTYRYAGSVQHEGQSLEKILVATELQLLEPPSADDTARSTSLEVQKCTGVLWFDTQRGRFTETQLEQSLTVSRVYRELRLRVQTETVTRMTIEESDE